MVRSAGKMVRKEIKGNAQKDTGEYGKSWRVKTVRETSQTLAVVVHIVPAEELGIRQLQEERLKVWRACWMQRLHRVRRMRLTEGCGRYLLF